MNDQVKKILSDVAVKTLEDLAFIFSFPEEEGDDIPVDSSVAVSISFSGPFSGTLVIRISNQVLPELTANMLGVEEEETTIDQKNDALKETINVICGNLLPAIAGKDAVFNINTPCIISDGESEIEEDGAKTDYVARLSIDDDQCDLFLFIDGKIPSSITQEVREND